MKTLLIVEDEKIIRQGIKIMVQRSGVPVETIIECNNGELALEIIKEQKIDVMFTDIRMPKMNGIELVNQMQSCEHKPLTVAISGYDDFSYAVEMLRKGVREYLLKPIERDKLTEILKKLNAEIEDSHKKVQKDLNIGYQQMKHMLLAEHVEEVEKETIESQYAEYFLKGEYYVCCQSAKEREPVGMGDYILLEKIREHDIFIISVEDMDFFQKNVFANEYIGISRRHMGISQLRDAYQEALVMRKQAFLRMKESAMAEDERERIPEELIKEARKLVTPEANLQRVQQIGTERTEELLKSIRQLFFVAKNGRITPIQFENCIASFLEELEQTYKGILEEKKDELLSCKRIWTAKNIVEYEERLNGFIMWLHESIHQQFDVNRNTQKIGKAIEYIEEHYADDLNMAVVSNYISMNYSLFSSLFKQHTGSNFVNYLRDIRIREAKKLLAENDMKIIEISQKVGYDNEKHFMKIFKSVCGVSPSEYRKNMNCH